MKKYYIISLKWTSLADSWLTLWKEDSRGYTWQKEKAGVYNEEERATFTHDDQIPVEKETVDTLFVKAITEGETILVLPNNPEVCEKLGLNRRKMRPKKYKTC